jgi:glyoxalase family protein
MNAPIAGIHHVTAIATDPQKNVDFYTRVLGLRLVKQTVNFDDPSTYHVYYADELGHPGTILTFFPWPMARRGSRGSGQAVVTSFSVPEGSLGFWVDRLAKLGVVCEEPTPRFAEEVLAFYDPDGLKLELVAHAEGAAGEPWSDGSVPLAHAVRGFHGVTLAVRDLEPTAELLTETLGFSAAGELDNRYRFEAAPGALGRRTDVLHTPETGRGVVAAGTVHHVAYRVHDDMSQAAWSEKLSAAGMQVTEVQDRQYFKSIYFREPAGVLFELATDPPGFTWDEKPAELGAGLKLPPWLEPQRDRIERALPHVEWPALTAEVSA